MWDGVQLTIGIYCDIFVLECDFLMITVMTVGAFH